MTTLRSLVAPASCVACLACWLLITGAASGQPPAALTAMDYVQIQQLVNRLNIALDYCGNGGRAFADLFVAGGRYVIDRGDGQPIVRDTRDALIGLAGGPGCESRRTPPSWYMPAPRGESRDRSNRRWRPRHVGYAFYPSSAGKYLNADTAGQLGFYRGDRAHTEWLADACAPARAAPAHRGRDPLSDRRRDRLSHCVPSEEAMLTTGYPAEGRLHASRRVRLSTIVAAAAALGVVTFGVGRLGEARERQSLDRRTPAAVGRRRAAGRRAAGRAACEVGAAARPRFAAR